MRREISCIHRVHHFLHEYTADHKTYAFMRHVYAPCNFPFYRSPKAYTPFLIRCILVPVPLTIYSDFSNRLVAFFLFHLHTIHHVCFKFSITFFIMWFRNFFLLVSNNSPWNILINRMLCHCYSQHSKGKQMFVYSKSIFIDREILSQQCK